MEHVSFLQCYTANETSIYHFCIIIKDFSFFFSRVIIVQVFETVTFYVLLYKSRSSLLFSVELKGYAFEESSIVFSSYTFKTVKPISLVRGYIEVKISKHDIW